MLISVTSAGQIKAAGNPPYFVVIDRALRDEGTSYHYAAPAIFAEADPHIIRAAMNALADKNLRAHVGPRAGSALMESSIFFVTPGLVPGVHGLPGQAHGCPV